MSFNEYYEKWKKQNNVDNNTNNNVAVNNQEMPNTQSSFSRYYEQWKGNNSTTTQETNSSFSEYYKKWNEKKAERERQEREEREREEKLKQEEESKIERTTPDLSSLSPDQKKELEKKLAEFNNQNISANQKDITQREVSPQNADLNLSIVSNKEAEEVRKNGKTVTSADVIREEKALKKAKELNEQIKKGGADAVNANIENVATNFKEGIFNSIGSIASVPMMIEAQDIDRKQKMSKFYSKVFNKEEPEEYLDYLDSKKSEFLDTAKDLSNRFSEYSTANQYIKDGGTKTAGNISNTIGNMVPSIVSNIFLPGSGAVVQGLSVGGKTAAESVNADGTNIDKAMLKGVGYGTASGLIEKLTGGNILGKGSLDDFATKFVGNKISSKLGQKLASKGYEFLGENLEEFLENQVDHAIDRVIEGKKVSKEEWLNELTETAKNTTLTTAILNLLGLGGNTYNQIQNDPNIDTKTKQAVKEVNEVINEHDLGGTKELEKFINSKIENNDLNPQQKSTQNQPTAPINTFNQKQNNINEKTEQIKTDSENFAKQIDAIKSGTFPQKDMLIVGKTPQVLKDIGLSDLPITITQKHLDTIMNESGKYKNANYHGLGEEIVKQLPEAINNPLDIVKSNTKDDSIVLTTYLADKQNRPVIASIKIDGTGRVNDIMIDTNVMTSAYGRNNYDKFMRDNIKNDNLLYDVDRGVIKKVTGARLQLPRTSNLSTNNGSFINNSIPPINNNVNSDTITNNYAQDIENNTPNIKNPTRHEVIQNNREIARENIKNISTWKDKKRGLSYQLETMERNMFDIIPDKTEAQKINDTYFNPIHESEAQKQKFINKYNDKIKEFNLNKFESEAVQLLGEQKYNPDFKAEEVQEIIDKVNDNIEKGKIDEQKVYEAIETFRNIYDELFELENNVLKENGYKEKPYRKGYFPHFIDYVPETKTEKVLNKLGFKIDKRPLPTDIAGITEQFVPGKTWNKSSLERKGNKTDYNALKGFDTYIAQASDNIFHTENIQRLRGLENEIRYQYSDKGVQERIDNIVNDETLYEDEKQNLIDQILEQTNNPMPNLVTELRRYTNALANKKSEADRSIENMMGRGVYSTVNAIENRFGANAVGLNIGSAFTNFIPITQAWSQVSTKNMNRAVIDTVKSYINNDGFVDNSAFLTSRINQSEKLYKTSIEKISDKTNFLFNAIDEVTSNIVVRSKYLDNIQKGMSENEAIKNADQFARNVMSDRSKGALPTKFEEKNPITKAFTQFQLEVNNQYRYMFKDLPRDLKEKGLGSIALAFFKMFVGSWLYNEASEKVTGRRPAFDPIDIVTSAYKDITDDKKGTYDKIASIGKNIIEDAPFVGGLVGGGRIPINGAIPDIGNLTKAGIGLATGEMDSNKAINNIGKEVAKPLYYLIPPFGGGQIKKSVEGINTVANGGSYGVDSKGNKTLQFPVENANAMDYIKAGIFGKYALPLAKEYTDNNFKSLNANQTKTYKESNIPYKEYLEYLNQDLKKNEDKIAYINKQKWGENQKWGIYTNEIFSDTERKEGGSQLEDAKYAIKNGTPKTEYMKLYSETNKRSMDLPTQEEQKELKENGISLKNYINYQIKIHDETKKQKEIGTLDDNKQLKNKDKIEILINSNCSDSEKEAIYKKSINSQDKKIQVVDELGLPITQYLKYKQQDFANDKDSNGETISGTKKQKVYNYLNSIPDFTLSQNYKKIICKMEGITDYDSDVARLVVNNNNLTADEQKEILKTLGFKVDKNGNISTITMIPRNKAVK